MLDTDIGRVETKRTSVRRTALMLYHFGRALYAAPSVHTDYPLYVNGYLYAFSPDILCQLIFSHLKSARLLPVDAQAYVQTDLQTWLSPKGRPHPMTGVPIC